MFGPIRGDWPDDSWKGWWGDTPPYHCPVFVLTHHPRDSFEMDGGTTFHFVTEGIEAALDRAKAAAGDLDIRLGGGADTIKQYMRAGLLDSAHIAIVPVLLGDGERLLDDLGDASGRYVCTEWVGTPKVTHAVLTRVD
jgi:dihydrofolate reductase